MSRARRHGRGAALVEFALTCGLLFLLLFGIIELGLLFRDQATLAQAAREAARSAAVGSPTGVVTGRAISAATGLSLSGGAVTLEKSSDNGATWTPLGDAATTPATNDANTGDLVRAAVTYEHAWITSVVFTGSTKALTARVVMRRE